MFSAVDRPGRRERCQTSPVLLSAEYIYAFEDCILCMNKRKRYQKTDTVDSRQQTVERKTEEENMQVRNATEQITTKDRQPTTTYNKTTC